MTGTVGQSGGDSRDSPKKPVSAEYGPSWKLAIVAGSSPLKSLGQMGRRVDSFLKKKHLNLHVRVQPRPLATLQLCGKFSPAQSLPPGMSRSTAPTTFHRSRGTQGVPKRSTFSFWRFARNFFEEFVTKTAFLANLFWELFSARRFAKTPLLP